MKIILYFLLSVGALSAFPDKEKQHPEAKPADFFTKIKDSDIKQNYPEKKYKVILNISRNKYKEPLNRWGQSQAARDNEKSIMEFVTKDEGLIKPGVVSGVFVYRTFYKGKEHTVLVDHLRTSSFGQIKGVVSWVKNVDGKPAIYLHSHAEGQNRNTKRATLKTVAKALKRDSAKAFQTYGEIPFIAKVNLENHKSNRDFEFTKVKLKKFEASVFIYNGVFKYATLNKLTKLPCLCQLVKNDKNEIELHVLSSVKK